MLPLRLIVFRCCVGNQRSTRRIGAADVEAHLPSCQVLVGATASTTEILFFTWLIQAIACHSILIVSRTADPNLMLRDDPCCQAARHVQPPKPLAGCDRDQLSRQTWKAVVDRMVDTLTGKFFLRGPCVKCITILVSTRTWELRSVSYAFSVPNANSFCVLLGMDLRTF